MREHLSLKWGTLKGWDLKTEASKAAARRYLDGGMSTHGAMFQRDTDAQKQALCDLIDVIDGPIFNEWAGKEMSRDEAKNYVMTYPRDI